MRLSLGEAIWDRLTADPSRVVVRHLSPGGREITVTAAAMCAQAGAVRAQLDALALAPGRMVAIVHKSGPILHAAWLGAMWAGQVPTMVAPPSPRMEPRKFAEGFRLILSELGVDAVVIDDESRAKLGDLLPDLPLIVACAAGTAMPPPPVPRAMGAVVVVQHTSGTTGAQKAIGFTSDQFAHHSRIFAAINRIDADDAIASWLPLYHDMGFIACFVTPLLLGIPLIEMSPFDWVAQPAMLLDAMARYRATLCWLPNFAFNVLAGDRVIQRLAPDCRLDHVKAFVSCSEPVQDEALARFAGALAGHGVRRDQLIASYAMAENLFLVTQNPPGAPRVTRFDAAGIDHGGIARADQAGRALVSNGPAAASTHILIRQGDAVAGAGAIGEICISGHHIFSGYADRDTPWFGTPDGGRYYPTGDIGFLHEGELYVTGRIKDLIIVRGRNYYPQDVEALVATIEGVNPGRVVVFGIPDPASGTEAIVVLLELRDVHQDLGPHVALAVRKAIAQTLDTMAGDVRIMPPRTLVKSTSGKPARAENRRRYLEERGQD